jgi:hypothetical protein
MLQNIGNAPLTIASIAVTGADSANFQYTADPAHPCLTGAPGLGAGATCALDIAFVPQSKGLHGNAQLIVTDNSSNVTGSTQSIGLAGDGIVLSSISISAPGPSLVYNTTEQFTATGTYSDNSTATLTSQVTWASSATGAATINSNGVAAAVAAGQTNITASMSGVTSNAFQLTVVAGTPAAISVASGSGQSATVGTAFGGVLQALVVDGGGDPVPNASVTFTAPSNGAGATFTNGSAIYSVNTNSSGVATSPALNANSTAGSYTVTAAAAGVVNTAGFSLTNVKAPALTVTETAATAFVQGQSASFTLKVTNAANAGPTSGTVTVTQTLSNGLTLLAMNGGTTWNCNVQTASCSATAILPAGSSYPTIAVTVGVAYSTVGSVSAQAGVTVGGSTTNDPVSAPVFTACDFTQIGSTTVGDVQEMINEALGSSSLSHDLNGDGVINVIDLQIEIRSAMGGSCSAS